jgi:probable DNA repair protein
LQSLLELIDGDTTTITVNRRLARALLDAQGERQAAAGHTAWRTPDVLPYAAFLRRAWHQLRAAAGRPLPALLSDAQERLLWEAVIREQATRDGIEGTFSESAAARQAQQAFALLNAWALDLQSPAFARNEDTRAFRTWTRAFIQRSADGRWIDAGRAASEFLDADAFADGAPPERVILAGFDVLTPQQQGVLAALQAAGVDVVRPSAPSERGDVVRYTFADFDAELTAVARWARGCLDGGQAGAIGVIVPDLHRVRGAVERIFEAQLCPGSAVPGAVTAPRPFNISLGAPLSRITVVGEALLALELGRRRVALETVGRLLRSPYLGGGDLALGQRARLDARLRDIGEAEISLETLCMRAAQSDLHEALRSLLALRDNAPARQAPGAWSGFFSDWLKCLGWPGARPLDSHEYQAVDAFHALLDELARCGGVASSQTFAQALSLLGRFADEHIFQPRRDPAPVQIVGSLEAAEQEFSHLWVCGLEDRVWPPAPAPNPFLPTDLQREAGIPQAAPETQLALASARLDAWLCHAPAVVLSHAEFDGDEALRASPMIAAFSPGDPADLAVFEDADYTRQLADSGAAVTRVADPRGPRFGAGGALPAGVAVLKDQAACPMRAFACHRLGASAVKAAVSSLDPRVRGNLVHRVLSDLWSDISGQGQLSGMPAVEIRERIEAAVDAALERERRKRPDTLGGALAAIERQRLCALVGDWIEVEKQRAPFELVANEEALPLSIGALLLSVRPDRLDRLETGDYFLVDYKTGRVSPNGWFGPRPDDPQLAIYTAAFEAAFPGEEVAGAAYGVLRRHQVGFRGYAVRDGIAGGVGRLEESRSPAAKASGDWGALKREWRGVLDALAGDFVAGDARVAPKNRNTTCRYCDVMPLCRIFESGPAAGDGEEDA